MNESPIDTLLIICQLTRRVPIDTIAHKAGYHRETVRYHIGQLETLDLIEKKRRGYWTPTFEGPYDYESLYARMILHKAARAASSIPWLRKRIMDLATEIGKDHTDEG